jgi:hypothetical protein
MTGTIAATADRACLTIAAEGQTTTGIAVRFVRTWDAECPRLYAPLITREE